MLLTLNSRRKIEVDRRGQLSKVDLPQYDLNNRDQCYSPVLFTLPLWNALPFHFAS